MMRKGVITLGLIFLALPLAACSDDDDDTNQNNNSQPDAGVHPDAYIGPCHDDPVPVFEGSHQVLVNYLRIAPTAVGFDLNYDGRVDNLLGVLGSVANSELNSSMEGGDIIIPMEFFGVDSDANDDCLNFSFYIGVFPPDQDDDGERTGGAVGSDEADCNDWDAEIRPGLPEIPGDFVDNDCDGLADETSDGTPSDNTVDRDGDGYSPAEGDCDDRLPADWADAPAHWDAQQINPGMDEICGDGFDNNCNGIADEGCNPLTVDDGVDETVPIDASSLTPNLEEAIIVFRSARIVDGELLAGPSRFEFVTPIDDRDLSLNLPSAMLAGTVTLDANGLHLTDAMLGGVLSGESLDKVPNIAPDILGGDDDSTMLDIIVGPFGMLVALPTIGVCVPKSGGRDLPQPVLLCANNAECGDTTLYRCNTDVRVPDIDVDGDGIEIFLNLDLDGDDTIDRVDTCIDGDGSVFFDELDNDGVLISHCTEETDGQGKLRFVDGYSIAIQLAATPANLRGIFFND